MRKVPVAVDGQTFTRGVCTFCHRTFALDPADVGGRAAAPDAAECPACEACDDALLCGQATRARVASELRDLRASTRYTIGGHVYAENGSARAWLALWRHGQALS